MLVLIISSMFLEPDHALVPISEHHGYGYTRRFSVGLATGTGMGSQIETCAKPVPVARVCGCGVATPSKKGTPRQLSTITMTTTTGQPPRANDNDCTQHSNNARRTMSANAHNSSNNIRRTTSANDNNETNSHNNNAQQHGDDECGRQRRGGMVKAAVVGEGRG